jgi:eukaryotic-like serine/threonine-protein kinase
VLVAIKYLHHDLLADPGFAQMFRGEATVLAAIDDLNVVRLYEYVETPSGAAIVMELVNGVSLREILAYQGSTTAEAALVVLHGSLLGLAAAHQRGVVHRDYKPENVLVNGDGVSKLTDFGLAARAGDRPVPAGTLTYAAPEQIAGAPASPASDVYAATATFYECLTGRPPFTGETAEILRQQEFEQVPLDPVPLPLRPVVAAGLAKDPRWRPADAAGLVVGLQTVAAGAYGEDWHDRGRSHLGEAALLLAALWPAGPPPATQGTAVQRISLFHRITPVKAAIAAGTVVAVAAGGTALAAALTHKPPAQHHPIAAPAVSVSLTASPTPRPSPSPSPTPSPTLSPSPSPSATSTVSVPPPPPPPAQTKVTVTVPANAGWVDTGIAVNPGDAVTITASGSWTPNGADYTGPGGFGPSSESPDNYLNTADLGVCGDCASTQYPEWGALMSYTGSAPPPPGSYTDSAIAPQAKLVRYVGSDLEISSWPYGGELWLAMNDDAYSDYTSDNSGEVIAVVTVRGASAAPGA